MLFVRSLLVAARAGARRALRTPLRRATPLAPQQPFVGICYVAMLRRAFVRRVRARAARSVRHATRRVAMVAAVDIYYTVCCRSRVLRAAARWCYRR